MSDSSPREKLKVDDTDETVPAGTTVKSTESVSDARRKPGNFKKTASPGSTVICGLNDKAKDVASVCSFEN